MENFEYKNYLQKRKMQLAELKKYYLEKRAYEFEQQIPLSNFKTRKLIHPLPLLAVKLSRIAEGQKLHIIGDKRESTDKPIIFASTHCHPEDPSSAFEAIKTHAYLFLGDPEDVYQKIEGLLLSMNGVIYLETRVEQEYIQELLDLGLITKDEVEEIKRLIKFDRKIAYARAIEVLKNKTNLLIFPEGAVNITPNLPVMGLFPGTVKMALETGADIVPMALERYGKNIYANIGENIRVTDRGETSILYYNEKLRDALATLKWEIWETQGIHSRIDLPTEEEFISGIMDTSDFIYSVDDIYATMYKDPNIVTPEEVFKLQKRI